MCSREVRRSRWSSVAPLYLAIFLLLPPIYALPEVGRSSEEAGGISEFEELKAMVSRLELILEKNVEYFNSNFLLHQEKDMAIKQMNSKIHNLQDSIRQTKKSLATSSCPKEKINYLEEEIRKLWSEARRNNFDIHNLESKAYNAEEKLQSISSQVQEMKDIVTEQWIQIRQLEQGLQTVKVRTSMAHRMSKSTKCTFLKLIRDLHQQIELLLFKIDSLLRGYPSHAFHVFRNRHYELQGYMRRLLREKGFTSALINQEIIFFLASAVIVLPFLAAYIMCSSSS